MYDPNDDTDVTSGTTDGAQMERTSPPVRLHATGAGSGVALLMPAFDEDKPQGTDFSYKICSQCTVKLEIIPLEDLLRITEAARRSTILPVWK